MKSLNNLSLQNTAITDEGLSHMGPLPALQFLNLSSTDVSDGSGTVKLRCEKSATGNMVGSGIVMVTS